MKYRCPHCRAEFEAESGSRCPACGKVLLTPEFFKWKRRPRRDPSAKPAPEAPYRPRPRKGPLALVGHQGFRMAAILIVLSALGIGLIGKVKAPPREDDHARKTDRARISLANLRVALEVYKSDCGAYPAAGEGLAALIHPPETVTGWQGPYIYELKNDLWGVPFQYRIGDTNLALFACGPDKAPDTADDIRVTQAAITFNPGDGTVYAVIAFTDGYRKIIREKVKSERAIPASLIPDSRAP